jgi:quinol monooxygenase YgiN
MANFFVGTVSWYSSFFNEVVIYISAPVTHLLYIVWSHKVDEMRQNHALTVGETKEDCLLPVQYRFKGAAKFIGVGFILGLFMLIGVPTLIGECTTEPPVCIPNGPITGTSVALINRGYENSFVQLIEKAKLVESAKKFKGNVNYKLVQNAFNPREFRFIETWESFQAVNVWRNSTVPKTLFTSTVMKNALSGGTLTNFGAYKTIRSGCTVVAPSPLPKTPSKSLSSDTTSMTATK